MLPRGPGPTWRDAIASQARVLVTELARARQGDVRGIHRARTSSRRLREVLPVAAVAAPGAGIDRTRREIRRITRVLGPVRELDVAIAEFAEAAGQPGRSRGRRDRAASDVGTRPSLSQRDRQIRHARSRPPARAARGGRGRRRQRDRAARVGARARRAAAPARDAARCARSTRRARSTCPSAFTRCASPPRSCGMVSS